MTVPNTVEPISIVDVQLAVKEERKEPEEQSEPCAVCYDAPGAVRQLCGSDCELQVCAGCAGQLVRTALDESYAGVVPTIRCACRARRVVPMATWGPLLDAEAEALFFERAASTLSLQCASCHSRGTLLRTAEQGAELAEAGRLVLSEDDELSALLRAFEAGTELPAPVVERVYASFGDARAVMESVVATVADPERRARLQMSHLARDPFTKTPCHQIEQCFRCKTRDAHEGRTCEEVQARRASDVILHCPQCNLALAKGDGCSSISCMCGHSFSWVTLKRAYHERQAAELAAWYEQHLRTAAYLRAEAAGFAGSEEEHWLAAEAELGTLPVFAVRVLRDGEGGDVARCESWVRDRLDEFMHTAEDSRPAREALAASWAEAHAEHGNAAREATLVIERPAHRSAWEELAAAAHAAEGGQGALEQQQLYGVRAQVRQAIFRHAVRRSGAAGPLEFSVALLMDESYAPPDVGAIARAEAAAFAHNAREDPNAEPVRAAAYEAAAAAAGLSHAERVREFVEARHPTRQHMRDIRGQSRLRERERCVLAWALTQDRQKMARAAEDHLVASYRSYFASDEEATAAAVAGDRRPEGVDPARLMRPRCMGEAARLWLEQHAG